jgi:hypothetical protein
MLDPDPYKMNTDPKHCTQPSPYPSPTPYSKLVQILSLPTCMLNETADVVFADDEEKLCGHGGDVLVRASQQRHQPVPQRAPLLRFILLNTVIYKYQPVSADYVSTTTRKQRSQERTV